MSNIADVGKEYGLTFNWKKLELVNIRTQATIRTPSGEIIPPRDRMLYLGSLISADGRVGNELNRRLGMAKADFLCLQKVWSHAAIGTARKMAIFNCCILS